MKATKYQVFISSTYSDLIEEREGVIKAILEMYHIPIGMEMFSAEDEDQWEIIRRTIDVSDYYILILGLRYGSKTSDGISFTQKEYEYALAQKIPILAFVMDDRVSLPKNKRDDDLTEINAFRKLVLTNSKMAQFWTNKDELLKNVSISLMKQIMQKPGIGWVRGDQASSEEALLKELTAVSKENRELRETITQLESKISPKLPKIELQINPIITVDEKYNSYDTVALPKAININEIAEHLREYITEEEINIYNDQLPSQSIIDEYNAQLEKSYKIENYSTPLAIEVCNAGTVKANNLYIDINFPEELLVLTEDTENNPPENPIPHNPIHTAQAKYKNSLHKVRNRVPSPTGFNSSVFSSRPSIASLVTKIRPINQTWWTNLQKNQLTIRMESLLHTRCKTFNNEYLIVPLKNGIHKVEVSIICEELEIPFFQTIEIEVKERL